MKRRTWFIIGGVAVVLAIGLTLGLTLILGRDGDAASRIQSTVRVGRGDIIQTLTVYGKVVPKQQYTFTFAGSQISEILVGVRQRVEGGQILVKLDNAREELSMLQAERALQEAQVEGVPAVIREKEISYQLAVDAFDATTLRAPFVGVVSKITQATTSNGNWSLEMIDTSELRIEAEVNQLDAPSLSIGQQARAIIEPLPGRTWLVEIIEIGGMATTRGNSTVVVVTGRLLQADETILVGYTAEMDITIASAIDVLRVPVTSLTQLQREGWMVMKVVDGVATPQPVTIGVISDAFVEIKSGLEEGDLILLDPSGIGAGAPPNETKDVPRGQKGFPGGSAPTGGFQLP